MSFNTIGFAKLLEVTERDLQDIKENLRVLVVDSDLTEEEKQCLISDAFVEIEHWARYYKQYKEILDHEVEQLKEENIMLKERINMMDKVLETRDANSNMMQVDIIDEIDKLEKAVNLINENAKALTLSKKLKSEPRVNVHGEGHPRYDSSIDNNSLIADYKSGMILKELSDKYRLSIPGIRNRLIDLGVYQAKYNKDK